MFLHGGDESVQCAFAVPQHDRNISIVSLNAEIEDKLNVTRHDLIEYSLVLCEASVNLNDSAW